MTSARRWPRGSRRLSILLLAVVVPPAAALAWLGWHFIEQDAELTARRALERREAIAQLVRRSIGLSLSEAARSLTDGPVPDGSTRLHLSVSGVFAEPESLLWTPTPAPGAAPDSDAFAAAERIEFGGASGQALAQYTTLSRTPDPAIRAGALLRLGRLHRRASRWDDALRAYRALASIPDVAIDEAPADLQARRMICDVLDAAGRTTERAAEAASLGADLVAGRWGTRVDRALWRNSVADVERWTGRPLIIPGDRAQVSAVADLLWSRRSAVAGPDPRGSWQVLIADGRPVSVLSASNGAHHLVVAPTVIETWRRDAEGQWADASVRVTIDTSSGAATTGELAPAGDVDGTRIPAGESGLPWALTVSTIETSTASAVDERRRMLVLGVVAILLLLAGSSYFLWRVLRREMAVARLQSEFVATVSHEFRTPLTSLRHVTELLEESDEVTPDERRSFYGTLNRSTGRLQRLVESLLDFSRLEAGRAPYDLQAIDAVRFTRDVISRFEEEARLRGIEMKISSVAKPVWMRADRASLTNALWNLLDNAVKYGGATAVVTVSVEQAGTDVAISVRDDGPGIPADEQEQIFERFVRGRTASRLGIGGTGLGLAIVTHVVAAHGGRVSVSSCVGQGSTFTITLPGVNGSVEHVPDAHARGQEA